MMAAALRELSQDVAADRLPPAYREELARAALDLGFGAAERYPARPAAALAAELGIAVELSEEASTAGGYELRAETTPGTRRVKLYLPALRRMAAAGGLTEAQAVDLALAHEVFHCLEPELDLDRLPRYEVRWGPWRRKLLPRRAKEIAAHAFAMRVARVGVYPGDL